MAQSVHSFDDSAGYERLIGRWSRAAGTVFLEWLAPPANARWLEVGCGTGVFTELILDRCAPLELAAIDSSTPQIEQARHRPVAQRVDFQVADAQALPFPGAAFDMVVSALVINFIPDRAKALSEMRRTARAGGVVAGYVWNFAEELSPSGPFRRGMRRFGIDVPELPGARDSTIEGLHSLLECAGLEQIATRSIEVALPYSNFEDFWQAQTSGYSPTTKTVMAMTPYARARLMETIREGLPIAADGTITCFARANAISARVPV